MNGTRIAARSWASEAALVVIIYLAFISLGLPDSSLGVAWPSMRWDLQQPIHAAGFLTLSTTAGSALSGFLAGRVLARFGTGAVVMCSGLLTGGALLGFSIAPSMIWMFLFTIPLGLGAGAVDTGLNHFVAAHYSSRHMNWLHGCWGIGATLGPVIIGEAIARGAGWRGGYRLEGLLQLLLAVCFLLTLRLWDRTPRVAAAEHLQEGATLRSEFPSWSPWLAASLYFVYAAVEMVPGLWAATILVEGRRIDPVTASAWVSCFWGAIMGGRFVTGLIAARFGNRLLVRGGLLTALAGVLLFRLGQHPAWLALVGLLLLGLGCAPIYPSLMHETPKRFDADTARRTIGRQVAFAYVGGMLLPALFGMLGAWAGLGAIMVSVAAAVLLMLVLSEWLNYVT